MRIAPPVGIGLLAVLGLLGQGTTPRPKFEVASIRVNPGPFQRLVDYSASGNRVTLSHYPFPAIVQEAYDLKPYQFDVTKVASQLLMTVYDIQAVAAQGSTPTRSEFRQMLQDLLADRFHMGVHKEMREMPVYLLTVGKDGPKFKQNTSDQQPAVRGGVNGRNQTITMVKQPLSVLASNLRIYTDRPVLDRTGLTGEYDMKFEATPIFRLNTEPSPDDVTANSALQPLGLKLEPSKEPVEVLVIDRAEKPTEN